MLWTEKYAPKHIDDVFGNEQAKSKLKTWVLNWMRGAKSKPVLIYGPVGVGKTASAYALAGSYGFEVLETNAGDYRDKKSIDKVLMKASESMTIEGKRRLILIDDVDSLEARDRGGIQEILRVIEHSRVPIILTAKDAYSRKISPLRTKCEFVQFKKLTRPTIMKALKRIRDAEGISVPDSVLEQIASSADGDLRGAINDLQAGISSKRERSINMLVKLSRIFKGKSFDDCRKAVEGFEDYGYVKLWIEENIPLEFKSLRERALAFLWLSEGDLFEARMRRNWKLFKYVVDFYTNGIRTSRLSSHPSFVKYAFPNYLRIMSRTKASRDMVKRISIKIASRIHSGVRNASELIPIVAFQISLGNIPDYGFSDDEIKFLKSLF